jgi:hypothetical protein
VTKEVYDYAVANKLLKYKSVTEVLSFPIDLSAYEKVEAKAINYTLPF